MDSTGTGLSYYNSLLHSIQWNADKLYPASKKSNKLDVDMDKCMKSDRKGITGSESLKTLEAH